ncbi:MAG: carboxypeptidase regulatory-like domain-containing protein [Terriglobia bacterium]
MKFSLKFSRIATVAGGALLLLMLGASSLHAQFSSGLEGTVFDQTGAVVPNAEVTLKQVNTGVEHSTVTSSAGIYRFTALPASTFTLTVKASGFETESLADISIQVAETRTLNVNLKLGGATTTVDVTAQVTAVNLTTASVSGEVNETKIHELPLVGRNMFTLVILTPGMTGTQSGGGNSYAQATGDIFNAEYGVSMNANGQRSESNQFSVDGANVNGAPRGGVTNLTPNADSVQEVRVMTNNFSAENGRNAAAIVSIVSKAGTNDYHGTMSWFHSDTHLNARNIFQTNGGYNDSGAPEFLRNEFAGSFGGPIRKDKDFAFGSFDMLRSGVGFGGLQRIPTPQLTNYLMSNFPNNISTKLLTEFPPSFAPITGINSAGTDLGINCANEPSASTPISTPIGMLPCNFPVNGQGDQSGTIFRNGIQWNARVDHNWNDFKDRLFGSFYRTTRQTVAFGTPSVYYPAFSPAEPQYTHLANLNWTHSSGSNFVNQMTAAYTRTFGNDICVHCEVPNISIGDGTAGPGNGFFGEFRQNNYEWKDVATVTRGRQSFKFGANWARHHDDEDFTGQTQRPNFFFTNVLNYAADSAFSESNINFDPRTGVVGKTNVSYAYRNTDLGAFFQDDFKVRTNLTLNMGVRWDAFTGPTEKWDRLNSFIFPGSGNFQDEIANGAMGPVPQLWHTQIGNFSPRLGFAWDPTHNGKASIRGGAGMFYDRPAQQLYTGDRQNLPRIANASASVLTPNELPAYALGGSGDPPYDFPAVQGIKFGLDAKNGLPGANAGQEISDPNMKIQYGENWSLGAQYEVFHSWLAEADYIGSAGHHEYSSYDVNRFDGALIMNQGNLVRPNTSFGTLNFEQAQYNSSYQGMTASIKNRGFSRGINFQAAYTYGKAIDQSDTFGVGPNDIFNLEGERGPAGFDVRNRLSFSTLWQIPHVKSQLGFMNVLLSGWQISNITILQSGNPFDVTCGSPFSPATDASGKIILPITQNTGCNYNADGVGGGFRPNVASGVKASGFSKKEFLNGVFNCTALNCGNLFPAPGFGQDGTLGRNAFTGPGYNNTDFSATKRTHIPWFYGTEGAQMEFRAEFFNVFNRVNLTGVDSAVNDGSGFGKATGSFPARDIQFGLRFEF